MTSPFRSTRAFAARRQPRVVVERSTFVIVTAGRRRYGVPVEWVERVLRLAHKAPTPPPAAVASTRASPGMPGPRIFELARALGEREDPAVDAQAQARVLVLRAPTADARPVLWQVAAVHEVFAIDVTQVGPVMREEAAAPAHPAVRGAFLCLDQRVWVLDPSRFSEPS